MPLARDNFHAGSRNLASAPIDYVIEVVVVFQGVRADDVVIVRVLEPEDQSRGPVHIPRNSFELYIHFEILERTVIRNDERKAVVGLICRSLREHIGLGWRAGIRLHDPLGLCTVASQSTMKVRRQGVASESKLYVSSLPAAC